MRARDESVVPLVGGEFSGADLGDERRARRLVTLAGALAEDPAASFPEVSGGDAALEATYRFFGNEAVQPEFILGPHFEQTARRASLHESVLVLHDTSSFVFAGEGTRSGLGPLRGKGQGFFGHVSLALEPGEARRPLGALAFSTIVRGKVPKRKRGNWAARKNDPHSEADRWFEGVEKSESRLGGRTSAIHVMDREGDSYALFVSLVANKRRFVIRLTHDRGIVDEGQERSRVSDALRAAPVFFERTVPLSRRKAPIEPKTQRIHPPREARLAKLRFSVTKVAFRRPTHLCATAGLWSKCPSSLPLNVVHVFEEETNGNEKPVEWMLVTTEPVETVKDVEVIVDIYRARWTIEEFFKAIKTGCGFEKRQLESRHSLLNALAVFIPIAWRLLLLRTLARTEPAAPASEAITPSQLAVLAATSKGRVSTKSTAQDVFLAIATLGGHIKNNGAPGWQVLGRGYEKLLVLELGWIAGRQAGRKK